MDEALSPMKDCSPTLSPIIHAALVVALTTAPATLCSQTSGVRVPDTVRVALASAVRQEYEAWAHASSGRSGPFTPDSLRVATDTSAVIPGLSYYWGYFRPPRTGDILISAVVAEVAGHIITIQSDSDWAEALRFSGWLPATSQEAVTACAELIQTAGPRADREHVQVFEDTAQFTGHWPAVMRMSELARRADPPRTLLTTEAWLVSLWAVEPWRSDLYGCAFRLVPLSNHPGAQLALMDSLPGVGFGTGP
jgi:hypothetical protein